MKSSFRRAGALIATMSLIVMLAPFVAPAGAASCGGRIRETRNGSFVWISITAPRFSTGGAELTSYAVDPADSNHLYATNGSVVAVSRDGGCKWKETFSDDLPVGGAIREIVASAPDTAALTMASSLGPRVAVTDDGGGSWSTGGVGLPPQGDPEALLYAKSAPSNLFIGVDVGGGALDSLYASTDFGQTWLLRSDLTDVRASAGIEGFSIDDVAPASMWAWGSGGLYHSVNGGAKFTPVSDFNGKGTGHLVARQGEAMVFLPEEKPSGAQISNDNGQAWFRVAPTSGPATSADHGPGPGSIVISAGGRAFIYNSNAFDWFDLEAPNPGFTDVRFQFGGGPSVFGRTARTIERLAGFAGNADVCLVPADCPLALAPGPDVSLIERPEQTRANTSLGPKGRRVVLKRGESRTVPYRLRLPERPVPLDVFFLVDTSNSMTRTINGLLESLGSIANGLLRENVDVEFGLAEYKSYPTKNPPDDQEKNVVYRRVVNIPAPLPVLQAGLESLRAAAGGHYDAHLRALYETATGEGQDVWPVGIENQGDVAQGQQASFRAKGLRVVIHASDERFGREGELDITKTPQQGPPPDIPSFEEAIAALNGKEIEHVGLSVGRQPFKDMQKVSAGTGTLATGPVDCDGDGTADLDAGTPLVCRLSSYQVDKASNLVPAVLGLLRAIQHRSSVSLDVAKGEAVVRNITPATHEGVLLQTENLLEFEVTYRCGASQAGKRFPVRLQARADIPLGTAVDATVVCKEEPVAVPVSSLSPLVALIVPPPPPPPPAPVSQLNPATQTQAQAQAQGAAAHQEQEETQVAAVTSYDETDFQEEAEFAMSSYRSRREVPAEAFLGVGTVATGMMFAAALALRRRHQIRLALQRRRI